MKVATFQVGLARGVDYALAKLDEKTNDLGDVVIHSVNDSLMKGVTLAKKGSVIGKLVGDIIIRAVVYSEKRRRKTKKT